MMMQVSHFSTFHRVFLVDDNGAEYYPLPSLIMEMVHFLNGDLGFASCCQTITITMEQTMEVQLP